jgi:hypothetical protein
MKSGRPYMICCNWQEIRSADWLNTELQNQEAGHRIAEADLQDISILNQRIHLKMVALSLSMVNYIPVIQQEVL